MSKNDFDEEERRNPLVKIVLFLIALILIFLLVTLFTRGCESKNIEKTLLDASKKYFENSDKNLPEAIGQCSTVTLDFLVNEKKISNAKDFSNCDGQTTKVKVCKVATGKYQYTPVISCGTNDDTVFGDFKVGDVKDLVVDKSDVRFKYSPEVYTSKQKNYYPNNKTSESEVNELYTSAPATDYTYKDKAVNNAAKWYKETTGTTYWNNGAYSSTAPAGYPTQGKEGTSIVALSLTAPSTESYRTIEKVDLYRTRKADDPHQFRFICLSTLGYGEKVSPVPCRFSLDSYTEQVRVDYTCDDETVVAKDSKCPKSEWTAWTTNECSTSVSEECETKKGYKYTDKTYQWYVTGTYRSYYPSGSANAAGEKTYFVSAPASGYVKDNATVTTAYKYYKLSNIEGSSSKEGEWVKLSDSYLELEEMLDLLKNKGYEINNLKDIENEKDLKYSIQLEYANRK